MSKRVFVLGASGFQGGAIAKEIISQGHTVCTLTSNVDHPNLETGVEAYLGSLGDRVAIEKALKNVEVAVYTFPLIFDMVKAIAFTQNFIDAAKAQNVSFVIFNAGFDIPKHETNLLGIDIKYKIEDLFKSSGLKVLTLMPDVYLNNLAAPWSIPLVVEKNILPYPVVSGQKVPWLSHDDLARFMAAAVEKTELSGLKLPIGGTLASGEEIAKVISEHLGKEITFISVQPDDFEQQLIPVFGSLNAKEISNLYRYVEKEREYLAMKPFSKTQELLNVEPSSILDWVASVDWTLA
ncbi:SDR family oxidoreductase [Wenyingzhuangia sp. IMCC45574]